FRSTDAAVCQAPPPPPHNSPTQEDAEINHQPHSAFGSNQTLRIDCAYERKTTNPLSYEFRLFKGSGDGTVVAGNSSVASAPYKLRTNITANNNLVCLYLNGFTTSDEGVYTCKTAG
ncbi:hypothetical protein Chor_005671, partial [Crotalus horridus]